MWSQRASAVSTCSPGWSLGSITSHPLPQSLLLVFRHPGSLTPTPPSVPILAIFCGQPKPYLSHRNVSAASFHNTCFLFYMTLDKLRLPSPECFAVQLLSCVWLFATPWTAACQASLSFTISWSLLKFISIESVMLAKYLIDLFNLVWNNFVLKSGFQRDLHCCVYCSIILHSNIWKQPKHPSKDE